MGKPVTAYQVENLNKVNTTLYKNGDIFITKKTAGILVHGKIKPLGTTPNLNHYVKKVDVQKMIDEALKKGVETNE